MQTNAIKIKNRNDFHFNKVSLIINISDAEEKNEGEVYLNRPFNNADKLNEILEYVKKKDRHERVLPQIAIKIDSSYELDKNDLIDIQMLCVYMDKRDIRVFIDIADEYYEELNNISSLFNQIKESKKRIFKSNHNSFKEVMLSLENLLSEDCKLILQKAHILPTSNEKAKKDVVVEEIDFRDKRVLIVDTHNLFFRTFFAVGNVVDKAFKPVGLIRSLKNILNYINSVKPDFVIFANEGTDEYSIRNEILSSYKAKREEVDEALAYQIPICLDILRKSGFTVISKEGYEADDIMASYAKEYKALGANVTLYTTDKDLYQLVDKDKKIQLYDWSKKSFINEEDCFKKFKTDFDKCVMVQAIAGDASDNVPGVKGIGIKGASDLVNEYGHIDNIYSNINEIKGATKVKLMEQKEDLYKSLKLVKLYDDLVDQKILKRAKTAFYEDKGFNYNNDPEKILAS